MKRIRLRWLIRMLLLLTPLLLTHSLRAQFYAPETSMHDLCQRHFIVEAARVQAWLDRAHGQDVAEVRYELKRTGKDGNEWQIHWLGADKKELRTAVVKYPESSLVNGPAFYRDVFLQLGSGSRLESKPLTSEKLEAAFWDGASRAGYSRAESFESAFKVWEGLGNKPPAPEKAAALAGLLAQTATHGFWQGSAMDGRLLARAAAWLCAVEQLGASSDRVWAPILFTAGREVQAKIFWSRNTNSAVAEWWHMLISEVPADDAIVFATSPEQLSRAMPMIAWQAQISDGYTIAAGNLLERIYARSPRDVTRLYDYAPGFADSGVQNGHLMNGAWAALARVAWVHALGAFPPTPLDYQGYAETLKKTERAIQKPGSLFSRFMAPDVDVDPSVSNLESMAPLLRLAYDNAAGPLIPVAHVTARDLLHYGWENAVLQMQARYHFVQSSWGVPSLGLAILRATTSNVPQFAALSSREPKPAKAEALNRLQYVNWTFAGHWPAAGFRDGSVLTNDLAPLSIHWLQPNMCSWLYNWWFWGHAPQDRFPMLSTIAEQGGRRMNARLLSFIVSDGKSSEEIRTFSRLTNGLPFATDALWAYRQRLREKTASPVPDPQSCREAEAMFWSNPNSRMAPKVFEMYLLAGEFPAAKKFYSEAAKMPYDAVSYSARMQPPRWALAMFENDKDGMRETLRENETGSGAEFFIRIDDALFQEDYKGAEQLIEEGIERYGAGRPEAPSSLEILRRLMTLRDALGHPDSPGHAHAVGYLVNVTKLPITQWLLIKNLKLSTGDAITFLGAEKARGVRKLMICYLRKDAAAFDAVLAEEGSELTYTSSAIAGWMRADLRKAKPTLQPENRRPANAQPIEWKVQSRRS